MAIARRIIEAIEACRPGSADLRSPALAEVARRVDEDPDVRSLYERVQQWDAAITSAMQEVSVPTGLADRILERLNRQPAPGAGTSAALAVEASSTSGPSDPATVGQVPDQAFRWSRRQRSRWSRRQWLGGFVSIAAALLVAAFLSSWLPSRAGAPIEEIAAGWFDELTPNWQDTARSPADFAVPPAVLAAPTAWQWIASRAGGGGVAYRLEDARGATAMLYVVHMARPDLPTNPPVHPQSTTLGQAVGYWQSGNRVYVLVVKGDERSYRSFIASSPVPLA